MPLLSAVVLPHCGVRFRRDLAGLQAVARCTVARRLEGCVRRCVRLRWGWGCAPVSVEARL